MPPGIRPPRLWTLLLLSNLATLAMPLTGLWALRLYESALVRQTEAELVAQGGVLAVAYAAALQRAAGGQAGDKPPPVGQADIEPAQMQGLDLARDPILPPLPPLVPAAVPAATLATEAGRAMSPILRGAQSFTFAALRLTDAHGVVVASTGGDLGVSLAAWPEVASVLAGAPMKTTMHRREVPGAFGPGVARTNGIRVFVVIPVHDPNANANANAIAGAVIVSRTARTLEDAARGKLGVLAGLAALLVAAGVLLALALASLMTRPLAAIVRQAQHVAAGGELGPMPRPGTREVADLSAALTRMAARLDQRARYISAFAASVSHAFKTPLAALQGAAELLEDGEAGAAADRRRLLHIVTESTARLTLLVTRMLDLARADMTRPSNGPANDVAPVLGLVAERYRAQGLTVVISGPSAATTLPADAIEAVFVSLLDNVQKHAGAHATVHIRIARGGARTRITVEDDGPGISAANQARVFDPFFTTAPKAGGTGLGLPIARAIVVGAGGSLSVLPAEHGARFLLLLP
jgi:signal transduction histidine kinase